MCSVVRAPAASIANTVPVGSRGKAGRTGATGCPIEVTVACLDHAVRCSSIHAGPEVINRSEGPWQLHPDDGATAIGATACRCSVQVPVCGLNQLSRRSGPQSPSKHAGSSGSRSNRS